MIIFLTCLNLLLRCMKQTSIRIFSNYIKVRPMDMILKFVSKSNIEFPKSPVSKIFRSMMSESLIYYNSNKKEQIKHAKLKL